MNKIQKITTALFISLTALLLLSKVTFASEGLYEMESTNENDYRCFAVSIQLLDLSYRVVITCRDLLYPAGDDIFTYTLWKAPEDGDDPEKLGELGFGRAEFKTKGAFSTLFVTTEKSKKAKSPEGPVVMRGDAERIAFLDKEEEEEEEEITDGEETTEDEAVLSPTPSARDRLIQGIKRAGLVAVLAIAAIIGLIFVLTRPK